jgi:hypothetical protein
MKRIAHELAKTLRIQSVIRAAMLILVSGGAGYWVCDYRTNEASVLPERTMPPLEYFMPPESFSRIENAKMSLEGLCARWRLEIQTRRVADRAYAARNEARGQESEPHLEDAIRDLELGMQECEGTGQELELARDLLLALKKAGHSGRWIEVYLKALYSHPMHPVVASFAQEAVVHGRAVGREEDVLAGLRHLTEIPVIFDGKESIEAALIKATPGYELTHADSSLLRVSR